MELRPDWKIKTYVIPISRIETSVEFWTEARNLKDAWNEIDQKGDERTIEIAVGENTAHHQSHTIANPRKIAFLDDNENLGSIVEIEEQNGTKTLLHIIEPMPLLVRYSEYEIFSTAA